MKKLFLLTLITSVILIGCNQQVTRELSNEPLLIQGQETRVESEKEEQDETVEEIVTEDDEESADAISVTPKNDNDLNEENNGTHEDTSAADISEDEDKPTAEVGEDDGVTSDQIAAPAFENLPEDASYEAMVLVNSGAVVHEQPDSSSKKVGNLIFGAHVFAIAEVNEMTYVYSNGLEGWVNQSQVKQIPYDSSKKIEVENPDDLLVLVNKQYKLPVDYKPSDLVIPDVLFPFEGTPERKYMRESAANALEEMFVESQQAGLHLFATSGFRSFSTQQRIFPNNVNKVGFTEANVFSAFPGESEHQTGLAMDVTSQEVGFRLVESFGATDEGIWVQENAHKFGFIVRYPKGKEHITGYTYEPWHLRYVGKEAAAEIFELNVTLEEYLGK